MSVRGWNTSDQTSAQDENTLPNDIQQIDGTVTDYLIIAPWLSEVDNDINLTEEYNQLHDLQNLTEMLYTANEDCFILQKQRNFILLKAHEINLFVQLID